jgi:hypothetical protein
MNLIYTVAKCVCELELQPQCALKGETSVRDFVCHMPNRRYEERALPISKVLPFGFVGAVLGNILVVARREGTCPKRSTKSLACAIGGRPSCFGAIVK